MYVCMYSVCNNIIEHTVCRNAPACALLPCNCLPSRPYLLLAFCTAACKSILLASMCAALCFFSAPAIAQMPYKLADLSPRLSSDVTL